MAQSSNQPVEREPRAIIHKRILSAAADAPEASVEEIADEITAATPDLVTRVLEEYGDPAEASDEGTTATDDADTNSTETMSTTDDAVTTEDDTSTDESTPSTADDDSTEAVVANPSDLSTAQIETLQQISRQPTATQQEVADELGIVRATVSNRLRDLEAFDWERRESFVETLFDGDEIEVAAQDSDPAEESASESLAEDATAETDTETVNDEADQTSDHDPDTEKEGESDGAAPQQSSGANSDPQLVADVRSIEARLAELEAAESERQPAQSDSTAEDHDTAEESTTVEDPALLHKAIQAILDDDRIDETEEIRLLRHLL